MITMRSREVVGPIPGSHSLQGGDAMNHRWIIPLTFLAVLVACGTQEPRVAEELEPTGVFVEGPCPVPVPEGLVEGESMRCRAGVSCPTG
jgi:hypothetical protein